MAGQIKLFEKTENGLLVEVPPAKAAMRRDGRRVSSVSFVAEVLWTAEEEAARDAEELAAQQAAHEQAQQREVSAKEQAARMAALREKLGLTDQELSDLRAALV